jgi:hypothetical protein
MKRLAVLGLLLELGACTERTLAPRAAPAGTEEARVCQPRLDGLAEATFRPPAAGGTCSAADVDRLLADCFSSDPARCAALEDEPCFRCAVTASSDASWGPIVRSPHADLANVGGCLLALDPSSRDCAEEVQARTRCAMDACAACGGPAAFNACLREADEGVCQQQALSASACLAGASADAVSTCLAMAEDPAALSAVLTAMCGVSP